MRKFVTCSTSRFAQLACGCLSGRPGKYLKQSHTPQRLVVLLIAICDLFAASVSIFHVPWFGYLRYSMFMLVKGEYFCWSREHRIFNKRWSKKFVCHCAFFCQIWTLCYVCIILLECISWDFLWSSWCRQPLLALFPGQPSFPSLAVWKSGESLFSRDEKLMNVGGLDDNNVIALSRNQTLEKLKRRVWHISQSGSVHCGMLGILLIAEPCKV